VLRVEGEVVRYDANVQSMAMLYLEQNPINHEAKRRPELG